MRGKDLEIAHGVYFLSNQPQKTNAGEILGWYENRTHFQVGASI